jgi:divalent metal cation (Fe/Co/Zn/Cd) transporter
VALADDAARAALLRRGFAPEYVTLAWNAVGIIILAVAAISARSVALATGYHPRHSVLGIAWASVTAVAMFGLAYGKSRTGGALGNPVLQTEGRVTLTDGILATAVLLGLALNAAFGWWWADPAAGYVLVFYAAREVREIFFGGPGQEVKA